jgi:hypothetical protein
MILQRVGKGLKNHDWGTVVLEVLIVVVGIFIGLQVDDWNEARRNRAVEQEYLERLWTELKLNETLLERFVSIHYDRADHILEVTRYILSEAPDPEWHARIAAKRLGGGVLPALQLNFAAYDELIATGRFAIIRNQDLRMALQANTAQKDRNESQLVYFRNSSIGDEGRHANLPRFLDIVVDEEGGSLQRIRDFDRVRGNQDFALKLFEDWSRQRKFGNYRTTELNSTKAALAILACELKRSECENNGPK